MNKKGFTLIELIAVISLLAVIALVALPAIDSALKEGRENLSATQEKQIIKGAKDFFAENPYCLPQTLDTNKCPQVIYEGNTIAKVSVKHLQNNGYLPANITNIDKSEDYNSDKTFVKVTKTDKNYTYEVIITN